MANWQLRIEDPSGEKRTVPIQGTVTLGRSNPATVILRDATVDQNMFTLWPSSTPSSPGYWIKIPLGAPAIHIGDLPVREAQIPIGLSFHIGETKLKLESATRSQSLPCFPSGVRPWLTCSIKGAQTLWTARKAAETSLSIYLAGETGTGKEVMAHLIHAWSERQGGPFIPLHCGALPLSLAESELFGHVKGAFTGAIQHRPGALMQAHGGTLFLDEVGDLPLDIQVKLLRFLENGEIRPVGSDRFSRANARIICATHHPIQKLVEEGKFRRDLYYRLASVTIQIPTLRSRLEDIEMLGVRFASDLGRTLSQKALLRIKAHPWPGNVRELRHAIERASGWAGSFSPILNEESFEFLMTSDNIALAPELELGTSILTLEEMERVVIIRALRLTQGNRAKAAKLLGIARSTLFEMIKRHRIIGPRFQSTQFS